jgi:putative PEP-CTERM system histidine kinase
MNGLGIVSYGLAAVGFLLLTMLLVAGWRGSRQGAHLIAASAVSALWSALMVYEAARGSLPFVVLYIAEIVRDTAWLFALTALAGQIAPRALVVGTRTLCLLLVIAPLGAAILEQTNILLIDPTLFLSRAGLILSVVGLVLLEQIYRNSTPGTRRTLRFFTIGVGLMFAYDLFLYSQAELVRGVSADAWHARGILNALAIPLIAIAARRNPDWSVVIFVSRHVVFYTATFLGAGIYLVVMAMGGFYVREIGGTWGRVGQILFLAGAAVVLVNLVASTTLRRHLQVFISKHFYSNKYDYRVEWLRFIATLSSIEESDVRRTAVQAIAQIFASPGGILFLRDDVERRFVPHAAWPMRLDAIPLLESVPIDAELSQFLIGRQWIIDTQEYRRAPDRYGNIQLPAWLQRNDQMRIVSPLLQLDHLVGFVVLYEPPPPFELTYEDRDLLKTVGRHVATHIAQHDADRKLAESRQFEAYNRLTAFMMHDLKNSVAQLKLIVTNAQRHRHNPEFIDDAIGTISNAADRMTRLIEQLRGTATTERLTTIDLADVAGEAAGRCQARVPVPRVEAAPGVFVRANPERLTTVVEHIVRNAQDATSEGGAVTLSVRREDETAILAIADTGVGMDADFVRNRLFRPFDSTKGSKGMGIGAYQAREYIRALNGSVEVMSSPGQGTCFTISLPLFQQASTGAPAEQAG